MCRPLDDRRQEMQLAAAGDMSDEAVTAVSQGERAARPVVEILVFPSFAVSEGFGLPG